MTDQNFTTTFTVDQTPEEAFAAITNVRGWWSEEIEGDTDKLGDVFNYHFAGIHRCTMKLTEVIPGKKVVWLVLENYFSFTKDKTEWTNTEITFEISKKGDQTEVHFTHLGLVPEYECFDACSTGWRTYINGSLHSLITNGKEQPNQQEGRRRGKGFSMMKLDATPPTKAQYLDRPFAPALLCSETRSTR